MTTYYVVTNTRGDVTQIYNSTGTLQVQYTYDAWGKILSVKDGNGNDISSDRNIGKLNSIRYRGYYYDNETGWYYLQSRYYNPIWGRFVNANDSRILNNHDEILTNNLFLYCGNNPVMGYDPTGFYYISNSKLWNIGLYIGWKKSKWGWIYGVEFSAQ